MNKESNTFDMPPIPEGRFLPDLESADADLAELCNFRLQELYNGNIPDDAKTRLDAELSSIIKNSYASIYMLTHRLIGKAKEDGQFVGVRGCVGSSFAAFLLGITGINPLEYSIPFEVFSGINGDKMPDIDLNFEHGYKPVILEYAKKILGANKLIPAMIFKNGVARHQPVGYLILPPEFPGGQDNGFVTNSDYRDLTDTLFKLDLFSHDNMTLIKKLHESTGVVVSGIPLDDDMTLNLLIRGDTLGIPEFGSSFAQGMIKDTKPKTFDDFAKIVGLSHSTGAWLNNAEKLIRSGTTSIGEVIAFRDDIMNDLMAKDVSRELSYRIMTNVRMARGLEDRMRLIIESAGLPEWYIASCEKIQYLFPKAHAVEYTLWAFRIAWFKAHYPAEFYKAYFDVKNEFKEIDFQSLDFPEVKRLLDEIEAKGDAMTLTEQDKSMRLLLELRCEMELLT